MEKGIEKVLKAIEEVQKQEKIKFEEEIGRKEEERKKEEEYRQYKDSVFEESLKLAEQVF